MIPALVLTAGLATRLRPLSLVRAKAAIPVAGRPLVALILERLRDAGVPEVVLNLHYLSESITGRIGDGAHLGIPVRYSWEGVVLGSAGGPRRAAPLIGSRTFLIVNGDTLATVDLRRLVAHHRSTGALVTLAVMPNDQPAKYGGIAVTPDGAMTGIVKRGDHAPSQHFVGVQVVEAEAFQGVPLELPSESIGALYPSLVAARPGSVRACPIATAFHDIGTPHDYLATCLRLAGGGPRHGDIVDSVLWDDVRIGDGTRLTRCVVTDGVTIPAGSTWTDRIIRRADAAPLTPSESRADDLAISPI